MEASVEAMDLSSIRKDVELINKGVRPNYLVKSVQVGTPFISAEQAIKWHNYLLTMGMETTIIDLTEYDWDANPANIKHHDTSTKQGMDELGKDLAMRNQTIIN